MIALTLVFGCGADPGWEFTDPGGWYGVDLHVHTTLASNDARGDSTPETYAAVAREMGLSLVVITDHSNAAGSMDCPSGDVEDCPNRGPEWPLREEADSASRDGVSVAVGVEMSPVESLSVTMEPTGHTGCIPRPGDPFLGRDEAIVDRPVGTVPGGAGTEWCHDMGGFAVINHPFSVAGWIEYDWSSDAYDAIEVYNGGYAFDAWDAVGVEAWLCDLAEGRSTVPVGGSDTHHAQAEATDAPSLDPALGYPTTWVRTLGMDAGSAVGDRDSLLDALVAGRTVVAAPGTRLDVTARAGGTVVGPGETLNTLAGRPVEVRIVAEVDRLGLTLELLAVDAGTCVSDERYFGGEYPHAAPDVIGSVDLDPGEEVEEVIALEGSAAVLVARVWASDDAIAGGARGIAIASPIRIEFP